MKQVMERSQLEFNNQIYIANVLTKPAGSRFTFTSDKKLTNGSTEIVVDEDKDKHKQ